MHIVVVHTTCHPQWYKATYCLQTYGWAQLLEYMINLHL